MKNWLPDSSDKEMSNKIINKERAEHFLWGDNCDGWVLMDTEGLSIKQESMPAGTREKLHFHNKAQQFFFILKGVATFYVEDEKLIVGEQKGLRIEPGVKHYIANETDERLEFLVISQPTTDGDRVNVE